MKFVGPFLGCLSQKWLGPTVNWLFSFIPFRQMCTSFGMFFLTTFFTFFSLFSQVSTFPLLQPDSDIGTCSILTLYGSFWHVTSDLTNLRGRISKSSPYLNCSNVCLWAFQATTQYYFRTISTPSQTLDLHVETSAAGPRVIMSFVMYHFRCTNVSGAMLASHAINNGWSVSLLHTNHCFHERLVPCRPSFRMQKMSDKDAQNNLAMFPYLWSHSLEFFQSFHFASKNIDHRNRSFLDRNHHSSRRMLSIFTSFVLHESAAAIL